MSFVITNIGTATVVGTTVSVTVGTSVPAGTEIVVCINTPSGGTGTCSDSKSNTYSLIKSQGNNNDPSNQGVGAAYHSTLKTGLVSTDTVKYDNGGSSVRLVESVFSVSGAGAIDAAVTASSFGSNSAPSVTSGSPAVSGELFIGVISQSNTRGITQPGSWATPPVQISSGDSIGGGNLINAGSTAQTYNPTLSANAFWGAIIFAFTPFVPIVPPPANDMAQGSRLRRIVKVVAT